MRVVAIDIHRGFGEVAVQEDGIVRSGGRVTLEHDAVLTFAETLSLDDHVVLEATVNTAALARLLKQHVARVVVANPKRVRLIAEAKVKTDKVDAKVLAQLYAAGFLPEIWQPDPATERRRRLVAQRAAVVNQRTRLKNRIHAVLHANLIPRYNGKLFTGPGRKWLADQPLPADERLAVNRYLAEHDRLANDLAELDKALAAEALEDERVHRLMTIAGVDAQVAIGVLAAIGDISWFTAPQKLVAYLGLDPTVRQSGDRPAQHGRISRQGPGQARGLLVKRAWAAASTPGPLRAFFQRVQAKRGQQIAAVATARKMAVIMWHLLTRGEDYAWARPALVEAKMRDLELAAGAHSQRGGQRRGRGYAYNIKDVRRKERAFVEQAETAYKRFIANWCDQPPNGGTGATQRERSS